MICLSSFRHGLTVLALFALSAPAFAVTTDVGFNLVKNGADVCKQGPSIATPVCFHSLEDAQTPSFPATIELVDEAKAMAQLKAANRFAGPDLNGISDAELDAAGGALFLSEANQAIVLNSFSRISVRNVAIDVAHITSNPDGSSVIPFYVSVYWQGTIPLQQGTLNVEGVLNAGNSTPDAVTATPAPATPKAPPTVLEQLATVNSLLTKLLTVTAYSDSTTEQNIEALRLLETAARVTKIKAIYGNGEAIDAQTVKFVTEIVGPAVIGQTVIMPLVRSMRSITNLATPAN